MYGPVTLCGRTFQNVPLTTFLATTRSYNPARAKRRRRFGLVPVRSPLLGESLLFSFPAGTKMFQFPAYAPRARRGDRPSACRVVPFGDPRITGHVHLPAAYRSLSRPSSLVRAKASTVRPKLLSLAPAAKTAGRIYFRLYKAPQRSRAACHKCLVYLVCLFHSMPKIACLSRILADWLRRSAFSQTSWRITDSNR